jgi:hypothetical protein
MTVVNYFDYSIPDFDKIVTTLEAAGIKFNWYLETPPKLGGGQTTQTLIIEKPDFYFVMRAMKKRAAKRKSGAQAGMPRKKRGE